VTEALALLEGMSPAHVLADKAYGTNAVLDAIEGCGARPIVPPTRRSKRPRAFDPVIYKREISSSVPSTSSSASDGSPPGTTATLDACSQCSA